MPAVTLPLDAYRDPIALDEPFRPADDHALAARPAGLVRAALCSLGKEPGAAKAGLHPGDADRLDDADARRLLRAALTVREPWPMPAETARMLDVLLAAERRSREITNTAALPVIRDAFPHTPYPAADRTVLWQGDITTLEADAIVNAANSALLGCFAPMHPCVDNAIHAAAGPRLREDCHTIMTLQGRPEQTGTAKITRGYHLPARYVLHTVGPIVNGLLRPDHEHALASSYRACLDLAAEVGAVRTVAFCSISTGIFGYPKAHAARVALDTVAAWLGRHPGRLDRVIFTVYTNDDHTAYAHALTEGAQPR